MHLQALLLQLARHLGCYVQLGAEAASEYRSTWVRRAVLALIAVATCTVAATAAWAAGLVALWDTPWRLAYAATTATVLVIAAIVLCLRAFTSPRSGAAASLFESEIRKDVELFQQWKSTL
ncbi:MAG: hypothetical protein WDO12_04995 [Pseudomonadota bacterium]